LTSIFITGIAGAAGSTLAKRLLKEGYGISGLDIVAPLDAYRLKDIMDQIDYKWKAIHDISQHDLANADIVVDFAAQPNTPLGLTAPKFTVWENLEGLVSLLECVRRETPSLFVYPSSGVVFGRTPLGHLPIKEDEPLTPSSPYAATKACSEILCMSYLRCYNVPVTILRIGMGFGPGMRKDEAVAQFIIKTLKGDKEIKVESPKTTRDPSYLENVIDAWVLLFETPREEVIGETFHVSNGIEITIEDLARKCAEAATSVVPIRHMKTPIIIPSSSYRRGELGMRQHLDISKAKRVLKWEPKISLEEGLAKTARWLIEEGY